MPTIPPLGPRPLPTPIVAPAVEAERPPVFGADTRVTSRPVRVQVEVRDPITTTHRVVGGLLGGLAAGCTGAVVWGIAMLGAASSGAAVAPLLASPFLPVGLATVAGSVAGFALFGALGRRVASLVGHPEG